MDPVANRERKQVRNLVCGIQWNHCIIDAIQPFYRHPHSTLSNRQSSHVISNTTQMKACIVPPIIDRGL
jgi:hypothetical protein